MNNELKHKLRAIVLSAFAAVFHTNAQAEDAVAKPFVFEGNDENLISSSQRKWNQVFKNVAKIDKYGNVKYIAAHRSHMSHRSSRSGHSSHYSHYSSSGSSYSSSRSSASSGSSSSYVSSPRSKGAGDYSLGDRTLKSGIHGSDVSTLTQLLIEKLYLHKNSIKMKSGYPLYEAKVAEAVKLFQKDAQLSQTGQADDATISRLLTWDKDNTTVVLGMRTLIYDDASPIKGTDITELVRLLSLVGFPPNPQKLKVEGGKTLFTADIQTAIKLFQAYNGLPTTGEANEATIHLMKAKAQRKSK